METLIALFRLKESLKDKRKDHRYSHKIAAFEALLKENDHITDKEVCQRIYKKPNITRAYRSLKYRVEEKLMNDILLLCSSEENLNNRVNASVVIEKNMVIVTALFKNFYRKEGILLAEKLNKICEKYYFTSQLLALNQILSNHFGFVEMNEKKMQKHLNNISFYMEVLKAEYYVLSCNVLISNMYIRSKGGFSTAQIKTMEEMVIKMNELKQKYASNTVVVFTNDVSYFYYEFIGDYTKGLDVAQAALKEIMDLDNGEILGEYQSKRNIALANFHLKNYQEASKWFEEVIEMVTVGTRNWFFATSLYYLNLVSLKKYDQLYSLSYVVLNNKNLSKFTHFHEQWKIREAYIHFLIKVDIIKLSDHPKEKLKPFSLSRFLNSMPFHGKDKSGQNVTIIILQILFLISDKKYSQIIDRIDALTQYTYRYLRNDDTYRSNCFIKMLILMAKADFNPIRTVRYTKDLRKKLINAHPVTDEKSSQVEIIPFDFLWDLTIELLETNQP
ncbi:MAG: tetratricopeptide repeat protein [Saprospiraceae bacterium]